MSELAWTTELPTVPGAYWSCARVYGEDRYRVEDVIIIDDYIREWVADVTQRGGTVYWYGPLTPPGGVP